MKTKSFTLMFIAFCFASLVSAQNYELKFNMVNQTGIDLYGIHVSPANTDEWGEDTIPYDVFSNGDTYVLSKMVPGDAICAHDIMVTSYGDVSITFSAIDLCEITNFIIFAGSDGEIYYKTE